MKCIKNEVCEKLRRLGFSVFPQIPQDVWPAHIAFMISEKSALCFHKKSYLIIRKKMFDPQKKGLLNQVEF